MRNGIGFVELRAGIRRAPAARDFAVARRHAAGDVVRRVRISEPALGRGKEFAALQLIDLPEIEPSCFVEIHGARLGRDDAAMPRRNGRRLRCASRIGSAHFASLAANVPDIGKTNAGSHSRYQ
ncbi:hypothetical protein X997_5494 [Burkholderia pseudomallei A79C]|nr:hypothetical protein X997_5494 [Burkholderia pseudomallei A79C]